jgi:hypothetical protein
MSSPIAGVARALRCTEGQAYTLILGLVIATLLAIGGIPPVLRAHTPAATPSIAPATERTQRGAHP